MTRSQARERVRADSASQKDCSVTTKLATVSTTLTRTVVSKRLETATLREVCVGGAITSGTSSTGPGTEAPLVLAAPVLNTITHEDHPKV